MFSESIAQPLYDFNVFAFDQMSADFFTDPIGLTKTLADTNLERHCSLSSGQSFTISAIEAFAPDKFAKRASLELIIGARTYLQLPLSWVVSRRWSLEVALTLPSQMNFAVRVYRRPAFDKPVRIGVVLHGLLKRGDV